RSPPKGQHRDAIAGQGRAACERWWSWHAISGGPQHTLYRADHAVELRTLGSELPAAAWRQRVIPRAAVVLRRAPLGLHPAIHQKPLQRPIERSLTDGQDIVRGEAEVLDDTVAMPRAGHERLQNQ